MPIKNLSRYEILSCISVKIHINVMEIAMTVQRVIMEIFLIFMIDYLNFLISDLIISRVLSDKTDNYILTICIF